MNLPGKLLKYFSSFLLISILVLLFFYLSNPLEISVTGTGTVSAPADTANFIITLSDSYPDSAAASLAINSNVASIRNFLIKEGIAPESIQENELKIIPVSALDPAGSGVRATKTLNIQLSDPSKKSSLTSRLYTYGVKYVSEADISVSNKEEWQEKAEEAALQDAEIKSNNLKKKYKKSFKKISSITPASSIGLDNLINPITGQATSFTANREEFPNSQNITKSLTVTYKLW